MYQSFQCLHKLHVSIFPGKISLFQVNFLIYTRKLPIFPGELFQGNILVISWKLPIFSGKISVPVEYPSYYLKVPFFPVEVSVQGNFLVVTWKIPIFQGGESLFLGEYPSYVLEVTTHSRGNYIIPWEIS